MQNTRYTVRKVQKLLQKTAETCEKSYKRCQMTDKPIIIDGVDVTKCRFYKAAICILSYAFVEEGYNCIICEDCPNCYYKQLQREKAVFRAYHDRDQNEITRLYGELQRKTAECVELEKAVMTLSHLNEFISKEGYLCGFVNIAQKALEQIGEKE